LFVGQGASDLPGCHQLDGVPGYESQASVGRDDDAVQNIPFAVVQNAVQCSKRVSALGGNRRSPLQRRVGNGPDLIIHCTHPLQDLGLSVVLLALKF
jgi:hypothetical protein